MYSHDGNRDIIASRCPVEVLQEQLRECSPTDSLLGRCVDSYFPMCPAFLQLLRPHGSSSENTGCLMYSIGVAGVYLVEDYMASAYGCEVHAFDYTYHVNNERHFHPDVYYHFIGLHSRNSSVDYSRDTIYGEVNGQLMNFEELQSYLQGFRQSDRYLPQRKNSEAVLSKAKFNVLKLDCEGNFTTRYVYFCCRCSCLCISSVYDSCRVRVGSPARRSH